MVVNRDIFLGSGASTTLIPEQDIYISVDGTDGDITGFVITPEPQFTAKFQFVPNIYVGCTVDIYDATGLLSSHTVASNSTHRIVLATTVGTGTATYAYLRAYGAPSPHPLVDANGDGTWVLVEQETFLFNTKE